MRPKILTVDDSKTIRMIVTKAFKPFDCEVFEAADGVEGLAAAMKEKPSLILLDLTMPIMDGVEVLGKLKADHELKSIPVIMLTAEAGRENVLKIAKMGVRDYIVKPFKEDFLIERVNRVIDLKTRGEAMAKAKRFDDPLNILVVDNKPAIVDQIREGLAKTNWTVQGRGQAGEAVDYCNHNLPDIILVSLSLPDNGALTLYQLIRSSHKTRNVPVFALSVKTAAEEQTRAQQAGFSAIVTKPIDFGNLCNRIARTLNLDVSYKYFDERNGVLMVNLPEGFNASEANTISVLLQAKVAEAVDAGLNKVVLDLSRLTSAELANTNADIVHLLLTAVQLCTDLSLKYRIVCSGTAADYLKNYEEIKEWWLAGSFDEALAGWNGKAPAAV